MGSLDFFKSKREDKDEYNLNTHGSTECTKQSAHPADDSSHKLKYLDTASLLSKLKNIAEDTTEYEIKRGAMCYSPAVYRKERKSGKCSLCSKKIGSFKDKEYLDLIKISSKIKKTGLAEVKIVCTECLVKMCLSGDYSYQMSDWEIYHYIKNQYENYKHSNDIGNNDEQLLKGMLESQEKLREDANSNVSISRNYEYIEPEYIVFLFKAADYDKPRLTVTYKDNLDYFVAFVENRRSWESATDSTILLRDNIDVIERLTGIRL